MKSHGLLAAKVILLLAMTVAGCQRQKPEGWASSVGYGVVTPAGVITSQAAVKIIDTVALLESRPEQEIVEFSQGLWAIAVKNLKTGYTYYYDSGNTFLGRKQN